tara:strand:+ start:2518 stop:2727 length:210 start_codon:yes stop_codon:yes gene_type:complete
MFQLVMTLLRVILKIPYVKNSKTMLKLDKWLEEKIGLDIIKQEQKWFVKHPLLLERIEKLEKEVKKLKS